MEDMSFYSTVAQVIPVLALALVFDAGRGHGKRKGPLLVIVCGFGASIVGEVAALHAIDQGHGSHLLHKATMWGLLLAVMPLSVAVLLPRVDEVFGKRHAARWIFGFAGVVVLVSALITR